MVLRALILEWFDLFIRFAIEMLKDVWVLGKIIKQQLVNGRHLVKTAEPCMAFGLTDMHTCVRTCWAEG